MNIKSNADRLVVSGVTELAADNATQFKNDVRAAITADHTTVEVDLSKVEFLDSSGLGALIALNKTMAAQNGVVRLLNPAPVARQVLELTRMHRVFEVTGK